MSDNQNVRSVVQASDGKPGTDAVEFGIQLLREVAEADAQFAEQCAVAIEALSTLIPEDHCTSLSPEEAQRWAWEKVRRDVGTQGWTVGDSCNFYGFFLHGWRARGQYEEQRKHD